MSGLWLFPNLLGGSSDEFSLAVRAAVPQIQGIIAESERGGRRFLSHFSLQRSVRSVPLSLLAAKPSKDDLLFLLEPIVCGETWGFVSDAGMPCLADPGAALVRLARLMALPVRAFSGPSSVMLALVLSGLPAQRFTFCGYLPRERVHALQMVEKRSEQEGATYVFMETPYRNQQTLQEALAHLSPKTLLCVACDLTQPTEEVIVAPVASWKQLPALHKREALFLLYSGAL